MRKRKTHKLKTIRWGICLAWKIDKKVLLFWLIINSVLSILPSITLVFGRQILAQISLFLTAGEVSFADVLSSIILFGVSLALSGITLKINSDFFYNLMLKTYLVGMQEILMEVAQNIELKELYKNDVRNDYFFSVDRASSLANMLSGLCVIIGKVVTVIALLVVAARYSFFVFYISILYVLVVAMLYVYYIMTNETTVLAHRKYIRHADYLEKLPETPGIAKEIRLFKLKDRVISQWRPVVSKINAENIRFNSQFFNINVSTGYAFSIVSLIAFIHSIFSVAEGHMPPDAFITLFFLYTNLQQVVRTVENGVSLFSYGILMMEKQMEFLEKYNIERDGRPKSSAVIKDEDVVYQVDNLSFSYSPGKVILDSISFTIKRGEVVALVGANGSGKSTLVKLLLHMLDPDEGSILMYGTDLKSCGNEFIRSHCGVFFQDFYLFHHTLRENIGYGRIEDIEDDGKIWEALRKGGAESIVKKRPNGLDTYVGKKIHDGMVLSGGERQRLGIGRAYMNESDVFIFDEPASMLDPIAEVEQFMRIKDKLDHKTAILISHRVGFARMADKIIMMHKGRIAECGTHDELIAKNGLYAEYFRQQAKWYDLRYADQ